MAVCPQDRLCEGNCVIQKGFESVTIGAVEKFVTENAFAEGWVKPRLPRAELAQSVAIIGAVPQGSPQRSGFGRAAIKSMFLTGMTVIGVCLSTAFPVSSLKKTSSRGVMICS